MAKIKVSCLLFVALLATCCVSDITARRMLGQHKAAQEEEDVERLDELLSGSKQLEKSRKEMLSGLESAYEVDKSDKESHFDIEGVTIKEIVAAPAAEARISLEREFERNGGEIDNRLLSMEHVSYKWKQPPSTPL